MSSFEYQSFVGSPAVAEDEAAVREGVATAYAATAVTQAEAHGFFVAHGSAVINHPPVGEPGRQGDPDLSRDAAD
jgi:hypothetical protein